jgi:hypothetical protein
VLEDCRLHAKRQRRDVERRHAEAIRHELRLEIEREREQARRRAAEQRRELRLEVEEAPSP